LPVTSRRCSLGSITLRILLWEEGKEGEERLGIIMGRRSGSWRRTRRYQGPVLVEFWWGDEAFVVYNTMDSLMKWVPKIERNLRSRMEMRFRRFGEVRLYGAVMMGRDIKEK